MITEPSSELFFGLWKYDLGLHFSQENSSVTLHYFLSSGVLAVL